MPKFLIYNETTGEPIYTTDNAFGRGSHAYIPIDDDIVDFSAYLVVDRKLVIRDIAKIRAPYLDDVNTKVSVVRANWRSTGVGQETVYAAKEKEARQFVNAYMVDLVLPEMADYPYLQTEIDLTGRDGLEVAQEIIALADQWLDVNVALEAARRTARYAIQAASSLEEIHLARDTLVRSLQGICASVGTGA